MLIWLSWYSFGTDATAKLKQSSHVLDGSSDGSLRAGCTTIESLLRVTSPFIVNFPMKNGDVP